MSCDLAQTRGEAFLDGELPANQMLELQSHVDACSDCRTQLSFSTAIRETTRQLVLEDTKLDSGCEERLLAALQEAARQSSGASASESLASETSFSDPSASAMPKSWARRVSGSRIWTTLVPALAAAAASALIFSNRAPTAAPTTIAKIDSEQNLPKIVAPSVQNTLPPVSPRAAVQPREIERSLRATRKAVLQPVGSQLKSVKYERSVLPDPQKRLPLTTPGDMLDQIVEWHRRPPTDQVTNARNVAQLAQDVGVLVDLPRIMAQQYGAHFMGGSVVRMRNNQRAAQLRYHTPDNRHFTIYIYDPERLPLHAGLSPSRLYDEPVYVGHRRGYSIAASKQYGVGYAVAGDLNTKQSAQLIRTIAYGNSTKH